MNIIRNEKLQSVEIKSGGHAMLKSRGLKFLIFAGSAAWIFLCSSWYCGLTLAKPIQRNICLMPLKLTQKNLINQDRYRFMKKLKSLENTGKRIQ